MKSITSICAVALAILLGLPAAARASDEGKVIVTISAGAGTDFIGYILRFHSRDGKHSDWTSYRQHNWLFPMTRDFDDANGNGVVKVLDLPAGDWAIDDFEFGNRAGTVTPEKAFSIPFTVKAGQTIYIGDYRVRVRLPSEPYSEGTGLAFVSFAVSDRSARDIPIAQHKDKDITNVDVAIPNIPLHTPYFAPWPPLQQFTNPPVLAPHAPLPVTSETPAPQPSTN